MFDYTINIPTVLAALLPVLGFVVFLIRMEGRLIAAESLAKDVLKDAQELSLQIQASNALVGMHEKAFMEYQVLAAEKFVTHAVVSEVKRDVMSGLKEMEARIETQISRLVPPATNARSRSRSGD